MLPTQLDQPVAVETKSGSLGPSEDLQGPPRTSRAPKGPFWAYGGTYMAPERAKMSYNYVLCTWEVLWGHLRPFMVTSGPQLLLSQWACEQDQKSQFWHPEKFSMNKFAHIFLSSLLTPKGVFCAILSNLEMMFLRKIHFSAYPILAKNSPKRPFLAS